jgi:hypothetical protein
MGSGQFIHWVAFFHPVHDALSICLPCSLSAELVRQLLNFVEILKLDAILK